MWQKYKTLQKSQLFKACKTNWVLVMITALSLIGQTLMTIAQPWPVKNIIDQIIQKVPNAGVVTNTREELLHFVMGSVKAFVNSDTYDFLYLGIFLYLAIIFFNSIFLYIQNICMTRLGQRVILEVRGNLFNHLIGLPHSFFDSSRSGDLNTRISKDTSELQDILTAFIIIVVRSIPTIIGILCIAFMLDWIYALTFILLIPLVFFATTFFSKLTKQAMRHQRRIEGALASTAQEAIYYHAAVASLSLENTVSDDLMADGRRSAESGIQAGQYQGLLTSFVEFAVSSSTAIVLFIGALRIMHGCLTIGQLMIFLSYLSSLFKPIREFAKFSAKVAKSLASNERIEEIMQVNPCDVGPCEVTGAIKAHAFQGRIRFNNIHFSYIPDHPVLNGFNLAINPGEKIALVGDSGSGKSTVFNLLMRFYDPQEGTITIDNRNIKQFKLNSLRSQIATVMQDSFIFDSSIRENIALAQCSACTDDIVRAAKAARAHDFITKLENGYETQLGESGSLLSGGQKRRLAIARAILRNDPIVVLDEPTAGLDAASERRVMEALDSLTANKATLIITHQLSTITNAHRIVVLENGKIAEQGTHEELLEMEGIYSRLWKDQTGQANDHNTLEC